MLPVLQAEVFCDCVENIHLISQLSLRVDVGYPQTAGVLRDIADLKLSSKRYDGTGELGLLLGGSTVGQIEFANSFDFFFLPTDRL